MSRILIVDDEVSICWTLRESLTDDGYDVEVASSAEQGLQIAEATPPDAVVLDVRLPGTDGLTAMKAFHDRIGPAPVIIITASTWTRRCGRWRGEPSIIWSNPSTWTTQRPW
jgi:DNA-binding NtrC family response regulator